MVGAHVDHGVLVKDVLCSVKHGQKQILEDFC